MYSFGGIDVVVCTYQCLFVLLADAPPLHSTLVHTALATLAKSVSLGCQHLKLRTRR